MKVRILYEREQNKGAYRWGIFPSVGSLLLAKDILALVVPKSAKYYSAAVIIPLLVKDPHLRKFLADVFGLDAFNNYI